MKKPRRITKRTPGVRRLKMKNNLSSDWIISINVLKEIIQQIFHLNILFLHYYILFTITLLHFIHNYIITFYSQLHYYILFTITLLHFIHNYIITFYSQLHYYILFTITLLHFIHNFKNFHFLRSDIRGLSILIILNKDVFTFEMCNYI